MLRLAYRLTGNVDDAKDVSQEVFLKLHQNLRTLDGHRDLSPWLYRVTVNAAHDLLRKRKPAEELLDVTAVAPAAERGVLESERRRLVLEAMAELPFKERSAVVLRDIEGLTTAQVAEVLGSSETTVRSQISVARAKLRRAIDKKLGRKS